MFFARGRSSMVEHKLPKLVTRVRFPSPAPLHEIIMNNAAFPKGIRWVIFVTLVLSIFFGYEVGNRPFADPDEGRYVEIPREMVISGDFVTPRLNDLKYFEKPPLFYWLQSASIKIFGINETSMRIWTVFFAILGCLSVLFVGSRCKSSYVGTLSASILAANIIYYAHSRIIILDLAVSVLMSGALWCFYLVFVKNEQRNQRVLIYLMYAFAALACLTKGLIGFILPSFVAFLWIALTKQWKKIKEILYIPGLLVFLLIFLPWHILVCFKNHDFFHFYFIVEHFLRYTTSMHGRYQPNWFFIPIILIGLLPWTGFSLVAIKDLFKHNGKYSENVFFASWIFGIFGFFSFSSSKLIPYILPIVPPIAFLTANLLSDAKNDIKDFKLGVWLNTALFAIATCVFFVAAKPAIEDLLKNRDILLLVCIFAALGLILLIISIWTVYFKANITLSIFVYIFISANMLWVINKAAPYYQYEKRPSTKNHAEIVRLNRKKEDLVFCYGRYYQDFPVYLNSTVGVVDYIGELEFGHNAERERSNLISGDEFWKLWNTSNKRIFLLLSRSAYSKVFALNSRLHNILWFDKHFIVIANK